jgi:hypothetical protein
MPRILSLVVVFFCAWIALAQSQEPAAPLQSPAEVSAVDKSGYSPSASRAPAETLPEWWQSNGWWLVLTIALLGLVGAGLAVYTARLWKTTAALLQQTKDMAKKELRSYVALDEIFFAEASDAATGVHKLRIRNYGQTPASRMSIWCERASHLPQDGVNPFYDAPVVDVQLLHPVQAYTVGLPAAPLYRIGKPGFFTYGRIIYHDIYGEWWVTKFCFRYEGEGSFVPHGDYNAEEGPFDKKPA